MRISVLAEFTNNLSIIEFVVQEELLWVLIGINFDFSHSVMNCWDLNVLWTSFFQPVFKNGKLASSFKFINQFFHRNAGSDCFEDLLNVTLVTFQINQSSQNNWNSFGVFTDLEKINFNVFWKVVLVQIFSKFFKLFMSIAQVNDWLWIGKFKFEQSILHFNWIITIDLILNDFFNGSQLTNLSSSFNIFVMNLLVISAVDNSS